MNSAAGRTLVSGPLGSLPTPCAATDRHKRFIDGLPSSPHRYSQAAMATGHFFGFPPSAVLPIERFVSSDTSFRGGSSLLFGRSLFSGLFSIMVTSFLRCWCGTTSGRVVLSG